MKRIELFGPPGVGKTTIYKATMALRNSSVRPFYNFDEARLIGEVSDSERQDHPTWQAFLDFVTLAYAGCLGRKAVVHARLQATRRALAKAAAIARPPIDVTVLLDESLCQRGLSLALSRPCDEAIVENYFRAMPAPAAVAVVLANEQTLAARNIRRKAGGTGSDRSSDAFATLKACEIGAAALRARGIEVVEINAELAPKANAAALVAMMVRI